MASENDLMPKIGLDTTAFKKGITEVNSQIKSIETSFRASAAVMENWSGSTAGLQSRVDSLSEKLTLQKQKLSTLSEEYQKVKDAQGADSSAAQSLANQMYSTEKSISSTEGQLKKYTSQLNDVKSKSEGLTFKKFNDGLANTSGAASKALKGIGVFVGGVTAALGGLLKSSMDNADELQQMSDVTGISAEQLQVMRYQGSALGVELDTMTGSMAKLTKNMESARNGSKNQQAAFDALGITITDNNGQLRDAQTVYSEIITALGNMENPTQRDAYAMQIFGKSAMELNPLIKAGGDQLAQMADEAKKNGAVMSNDAVAGLDNFGDSIDAMKLSVQGLIGSAFGKLTPQLNDLTEKIKNLDLSGVERGISFVLDHLPQIGTAIAGVTGAVVTWKIAAMTANVVNAVGNGLQAISAAHHVLATGATLAQAAATKTAAGAQVGLNAAILANPITWIVALIAALVAAFVLLWKNCEGFRNFWIELWNGIKSAAQAVGSWFSGPFVGFFKNAWAAIQGVFSAVGSWFSSVFGGAWNGIKVIWSAVTGWFRNVWNGIVSVFSVVGNWFKTIFGTAWNGIKYIWSGVTGFFSGIWNGIKKAFSATGDWFKNIFSGAWKGIRSAWSGAGSWFSGVWGSIKSGFSKLNPLQWGKDLMNGLIKGIKSGISDVANAVKGVANKIKSFLHFSTPDEGPLKDYEAWMPDMMGGLAKGIEANKYKVQNAIRGLSADISVGVNPGMGNSATRLIDNSVTKAPVININGPVNLADKGSSAATLQQLQFLAEI